MYRDQTRDIERQFSGLPSYVLRAWHPMVPVRYQHKGSDLPGLAFGALHLIVQIVALVEMVHWRQRTFEQVTAVEVVKE